MKEENWSNRDLGDIPKKKSFTEPPSKDFSNKSRAPEAVTNSKLNVDQNMKTVSYDAVDFYREKWLKAEKEISDLKLRNEELETKNAQIWELVKMNTKRFNNVTTMLLSSLSNNISLGKKCFKLNDIEIQQGAEVGRLNAYIEEMQETLKNEDVSKSLETNMKMLNDVFSLTRDRNDLMEKVQKQSAEINKLKQHKPSKPWPEKTEVEQENSKLKNQIRDLKGRINKYHKESAIDAAVFAHWQNNRDIKEEYDKIYEKKDLHLKSFYEKKEFDLQEKEYHLQFCAKHVKEKTCSDCEKERKRRLNYSQQNVMVETLSSSGVNRIWEIFSNYFTRGSSQTSTLQH